MPAPTFNVTLEELGQDAVGSQLVKHAAEELLGYACYIPWDQHAADKKIFKKNIAGEENGPHTLTHQLLNSSISTRNMCACHRDGF